MRKEKTMICITRLIIHFIKKLKARRLARKAPQAAALLIQVACDGDWDGAMEIRKTYTVAEVSAMAGIIAKRGERL
jgi:hypothetical protein